MLTNGDFQFVFPPDLEGGILSARKETAIVILKRADCVEMRTESGSGCPTVRLDNHDWEKTADICLVKDEGLLFG